MSRSFENKEFNILPKRRFYCTVRNASCQSVDSFCDTCICNYGWIYDVDFDQCEARPTTTKSTTYTSTTPQPKSTSSTSTSSTVKTTIRSGLKRTVVATNKTVSTTPNSLVSTSTSSSLTKGQLSSSSSFFTTKTLKLSAFNVTSATDRTSMKIHEEKHKEATATASPKNNNRISTNMANSGLIAGLVIGGILIIICTLIILYAQRRRRKKTSKYSDPEDVPVNISDAEHNPHKIDSPSSENCGHFSENGNAVIMNGIHTPAERKTEAENGHVSKMASLEISEPFYHVTEEERNYEDPFYMDVKDNVLYMDPNEGIAGLTPGIDLTTSATNQELDEKPSEEVKTDEPPSIQRNDYQELTYASNPHLYQPLTDDWRSKYNN